MKNIFKIVVLGVIAFGILVYATADKPAETKTQVSDTSSLTLSNLPKEFEIVGKDGKVSKEDLFQTGSKALIIVGNHDSLSVVRELPKYYDVQIPYVMVANISSAPWFVKKMFIPGKLEELVEGRDTPMIYDFDGDMIKALGVTDNEKTTYIAYLVNENGSISNVFKGSVKEGALDGTMSEEEMKTNLASLVDYIK
ncbi:hypothetical protein B0F89_101152 [Malaciobacter marinus]|jgi:hypothetical protein|uniref:Cytochrome oxidase Cu insertion factor, SCO1/SenC/PrrC family n=1 Tax=Malaciobacter marinus TaxID=505249 RepID=A0AB37A0F5_9BACT|nr:hypothetical protein [Malaciobacter marinus]PPK62952.1 hypothetical protein B0F89_101152 [Malaciobacter marinus]SKB37618.1 hypothetical protein SAMN06295997_10824 [Malaciobacter marinus]